MIRILLGLVVFVSYLIQAQDDFEQIGFTFDSEIQTELDEITNETLRLQRKNRYLKMFRMGHTQGHMEGRASAEEVTFLRSFECAANGLKAALEVCYKLGTSLISVQENRNCEYPDFPSDILNIIQNNDEWVRMYNSQKDHKKTTLKTDTTNNPVDSTVATVIVNAEPMPVNVYERDIKKSFKDWYEIITVEIDQLTNPFIADIQATLKTFHEKNSADKKFKTIIDVKARFAAHMARSFKMMCALHLHLNNIMRSYALQNPSVDFLKLFLKFVPDWNISQEQFQFLNLLRQAVPKKLTSLDFIDVKNVKNEWVVIPFDHSEDCARLMRKELPSTPNDLVSPISVAFERYKRIYQPVV